MNRGDLGDSEVSDESPDVRPSGSVRNPRKTNLVRPRKSAAQTASGSSRRKQKTPKRNTKMLLEMKKLQKSTKLLIPKLPFARLVRQISLEVNPHIVRYTITALEALQEATEMYITQLLQDANYLTLHRSRCTLSKGDMLLIRFLKHRL